MNDRLKFRAWIEAEGRMVYQGNNEPVKAFVQKHSAHHLLEYIGLKDSDGRMIYESDIIKVTVATYDHISGNTTEHISFREVVWQNVPHYNGWSITPDDSFLWVGNIYETPDLIRTLYYAANEKITKLERDLDTAWAQACAAWASNYKLVDDLNKSEETLNSTPYPSAEESSLPANDDNDWLSFKSTINESNRNCWDCEAIPGEPHDHNCSILTETKSNDEEKENAGRIDLTPLATESEESDNQSALILLMKRITDLRIENSDLRKEVKDTQRLQLLSAIADLKVENAVLKGDIQKLKY